MQRAPKKQKTLFDREFITGLVDSFNLVEFIGDYIPLTKSGIHYKALCPFHSEKTPSFVVSEKKNVYQCYGSCSSGGDIISFIMKYDSLSFYEAVKFLADKAGKTLPNELSPEEAKAYEEAQQYKQLLKRLNTIALNKWSENLGKSADAQNYLTERGITSDTIKDFNLGFADSSGNALANVFTAQGIKKEDLKSSGLCGVSESGDIYDRFKNRVITPVFDIHGEPIGFSGRTLSNDKKEAKYINTPETVLYSKGKNLFGLHLTKDHIKNKGFAIITEGNFDTISLYQYGVKNVLAGLGTAFTDAQAKLLKRFTDKVVICYDGDKAGVEATDRLIKILLSHQFIVKVMELPESYDPDSYIKEVGLSQFNATRGKSVTWFEYLLKKEVKNYDLTNPTEKAKVLDKVNTFIKYCFSELERREYYTLAVKTLDIERVVATKNWKEASLSNAEHVKKIEDKEVEYSLSEYRLLQLLPYVKDRLSTINKVKSFIESADIRKIALIIGNISGEFKYHILESVIDTDLITFVRKMLINSEEYVESLSDIESEMNKCIESIHRDYLSRTILEINEKVSNLENLGSAEALEMLSKQVEIAKEIKQLGQQA